MGLRDEIWLLTEKEARDKMLPASKLKQTFSSMLHSGLISNVALVTQCGSGDCAAWERLGEDTSRQRAEKPQKDGRRDEYAVRIK